MALFSVRLRRSLSTLSVLHCHVSSSSSSIVSSQTSYSVLRSSPSHSPAMIPLYFPIRSSSMAFSSRSWHGNNNEDDKIGPDTILFEGCDYNHWLITMDFPKDPKPTPEEMVRTYEETCAKGLNISVEEAKKKMYACSTTTYQGFQAVMTEEESEKFRGLHGVVFILPDSYIDPVNKEYGGDKYINGTIIPRPPPVQYGRQGGRYRDRNSNPDQRRYDGGSRSTPNFQGNPSYGQQGSMQHDGRNFAAQQNYQPQGGHRDYVPSHQGNFNSGSGPAQGGTYGQGQGTGAPYSQGPSHGYYPGSTEAPRFPQGGQQNHGTEAPFSQGPSHGSFPGPAEGQRFPRGNQGNIQEEQRNHTSGGQTWNNQRRF